MSVSAIDRAIILSAGKGSRLLPLTADRPKCLVEVSGRSVLEWQLDALFEGGIREMVVVTGFRTDMVEAVVKARGAGRGKVSTVFNPFYHVADNLGSAWMARAAMDRDFLLLNGDTLVPPELVSALIAAPAAPIRLVVDHKERYDDDDMKALCEGDRLVRVDKRLEEGGFNAESIGFLRFAGDGPGAFAAALDRTLRTSSGTSRFFLYAIDELARGGMVKVMPTGGRAWAEVDFPADLEIAERLTAEWAAGALAGAGPE